jgi:hypothetical protein
MLPDDSVGTLDWSSNNRWMADGSVKGSWQRSRSEAGVMANGNMHLLFVAHQHTKKCTVFSYVAMFTSEICLFCVSLGRVCHLWGLHIMGLW